MTRRSLILGGSVACAQDVLERKAPKADERIAYGADPLHFGDLRVPSGKGPFPWVINIHGGFWKAAYDLEHNGHLCEALRQKGIATWSIEYRRIGNPGGGWPGTLDDAKAAATFGPSLAKKHKLDPRRVIAMGHSAGGHLALYLGAEFSWLRGVISLAGVADLQRALELKLSKEIVKDFLAGTPDQFPERYRTASPIERLPLKKPTVLIHGANDKIVPLEIAQRYAEAASKAGDPVELKVLPATGHFELIDPQSAAWPSVESAVARMLNSSR